MGPTFTQRKIFLGYKQACLYPVPPGGAEPVYEREKLITSMLSVHFYSFWLEKLLIKRKQMNVQRCVLITSIFFLNLTLTISKCASLCSNVCSPSWKISRGKPVSVV